MVTAGNPPPSGKISHARTGNRTRDLMISSQRLWPLDHEAGQIKIYRTVIFVCCFVWVWNLVVDTAGGKEAEGVWEQNRVLRRIFGPRRDEVTGKWWRLHNEELNDLYCSPNIVRVYAGWSTTGLFMWNVGVHTDTTPPQPNHNVTPTHIEPEQYNPRNNSTNKSQAPEDGCINIRNILCINHLKPTGHVTHQQFNIQQLYALSTLYLCVL